MAVEIDHANEAQFTNKTFLQFCNETRRMLGRDGKFLSKHPIRTNGSAILQQVGVAASLFFAVLSNCSVSDVLHTISSRIFASVTVEACSWN
jgi:hypothetical protein